jgi:hypothetical protein
MVVPNLPRGSCRLIGGDLDIGEEGIEQNIEPLQSLHRCFVGNQSVQHEFTLPKRFIPASAMENTSKNEEDAI